MARVLDHPSYRQPLMATQNRQNSQPSAKPENDGEDLYKYSIPLDDALATYHVLC